MSINRSFTQAFKLIILSVTSILVTAIVIFFLYCNSLSGVNSTTIGYYKELRKELKANGYNDQLLVISSKRNHWHNELLTLFGASSTSRHLRGDAIDIMVMDVNSNGSINGEDVDIVYNVLNQRILKNKGSVGTYKTERWIWNRQMVHLDCRKKKTRWHR